MGGTPMLLRQKATYQTSQAFRARTLGKAGLQVVALARLRFWPSIGDKRSICLYAARKRNTRAVP